jgi:hypothetical protein
MTPNLGRAIPGDTPDEYPEPDRPYWCTRCNCYHETVDCPLPEPNPHEEDRMYEEAKRDVIRIIEKNYRRPPMCKPDTLRDGRADCRRRSQGGTR